MLYVQNLNNIFIISKLWMITLIYYRSLCQRFSTLKVRSFFTQMASAQLLYFIFPLKWYCRFVLHFLPNSYNRFNLNRCVDKQCFLFVLSWKYAPLSSMFITKFFVSIHKIRKYFFLKGEPVPVLKFESIHPFSSLLILTNNLRSSRKYFSFQ